MALLESLAALPPGAWLRGSATLYIVVSAAHIVSIGLLLGAIVPLDLRLVGLLPPGPLAVLAPVLARGAAVGLALALLTGAWLFLAQPIEYAGNRAFQLKLALVLLATLNALWVRRGRAWRHALAQGRAPTALRLHAALSLLAWLGCVLAGRWIGFL